MNDEKDLLSLFDEIVEESSQNLSKSQIKESERLQKLYNLSQDNVDEVFEDLFEKEEDQLKYNLKIGEIYGTKKVLGFGSRKYKKNVPTNPNKLYFSKRPTIKFECIICATKSETARIVFLKNSLCKICKYDDLINENSSRLIGICRGKWKIIAYHDYKIKRSKTGDRRVSYYKIECQKCYSMDISLLYRIKEKKCRKCIISSFKKYLTDKKYDAYIGYIYHSWKVLSYAGRDKFSKIYMLCQCSCGTISSIQFHSLKSNKRKKCIKCSNKEKLNHELRKRSIIPL